MRLLLDTHTVAWSLLETDRLSPQARDAISSADNAVLVSVASVWEIAIKVGRGKWPEAQALLHEFETQLAAAGFELLPITVAHVRAAGLMAGTHRDPFDRLLAAQAAIEGLTIVTYDAKVRSLGVSCLW